MEAAKQTDKSLGDLIEIIHFTEKVSARIHGVLNEAEIYNSVIEEFAKSKRYEVSILLLTEDRSGLMLAETSMGSEKLKAAERVIRLGKNTYRIDLNKSRTFRQVITEGKTLQVGANDIISELFPRPLAKLITKILGHENESGIFTPLVRQGNIAGVFVMSSTQMTEYFLPSVKALAEHISTALELAEEYTQRKRIEHNLNERVKELQCLYGIANIAEKRGVTLDEIYQEVTNLLPPSCQYPEITCARITINDKEFRTNNYRETKWKQSSDIKIHGAKAGVVEVSYLEERPEIDEGPFLKEERMLIDTVAERMGRLGEQKRAEEKIAQQNEFLSNVVESITNPFFVIDANDYTIKMANSAAKAGGLPESTTCYALSHKRSKPCGGVDYRCPLAEVKKTKKPIIVEHIHYDEDGNPLNIEVHSYPIFDSEGNVIQVIEHCLDITERKRAEEALRESEEKYRRLFELSPVGITTLDMKGVITSCNAAVFREGGYTENEIVGKHFSKIAAIRISDIPKYAGVFSAIIRGKVSKWFETAYQRKDGTTGWTELHVALLKSDGKKLGLQVLQRDITERKKIEEELKKSNEFNFNLIKQSPHPIIIVGLDRTITRVNKALEQLTGYSSSELIGLKTPYPWWTEQDPKQKSDRDRNAALARKGQRFEEKFQKKSGEFFWVEMTPMAIVTDGKPQYYMYMWTDITQRKQMEEELQEHYQQERNLRQELEAEIEKRVGFTRLVVHELKTPLTSIMVSSDLLASELEEEMLLGLAKNISRGASNLNNRIEELTDVAKGETGMLELNPTPLDPQQLLSGVVDDMTPMISSRGQSLTLKLPPSLPLVVADEDRLRQIVLNLLSNASKFTPDGGKITLKAKEEDTSLVVEVEDTGPGIAEEDQQRLFEPYYRLERNRERVSGLGLGLALCKTLVELHGGRIWVKSQVGEGSTFGFWLPLKSP